MDFGDALAAEVRCWSLRQPGRQQRSTELPDGSDGSDCVIGPGQEGEANISATLSGLDVAVNVHLFIMFLR